MATHPDEHTKNEKQEAEERSAPGASIVYEAIQLEGEEELQRSNSALAWSGLAAGLSMGFSLVAQGLLEKHLPAADWRHLLIPLGYTIGFLIVVLGRQQLFTENTLTVILPLLKEKKLSILGNVARLWAVVLLANLAGAYLFALVIAHSFAFDASAKDAFAKVSEHAVLLGGFWTVLIKSIFAGWLIALMVWMLPAAETARVAIIIIITWLVGVSNFAHIVAGASEVFYLITTGALPWSQGVASYLLPAFLGNIIGGVTLVAALNHAQVVGGEMK